MFTYFKEKEKTNRVSEKRVNSEILHIIKQFFMVISFFKNINEISKKN